MSWPSIATRPAVGSHRRCSRFIAVLLPAPVWPTRAMTAPGWATKDTSDRIAGPPGIGKADGLKRNLAVRRVKLDCIGRFRHGAFGVEDGEEILQAPGVAGTSREANCMADSSRPINRVGEAHEA